MSENIYGVWKRRFPILKSLRTSFILSQKIIIATAILFNLGRMEGEEDGDGEDSDEEDSDDEDEVHVIVVDEDRGAVRYKGQQERDKLFESMK